MKLVFAMLADAATVAGGKLYVHGGGWRTLQVDGVPTTHPSFSLVFMLELDADDAGATTSLDVDLEVDGEPVASVRGWIETGPVGTPGDSPSIVMNEFTFTNVPLPVAGSYALNFAAGGRHLGQLDLLVTERDLPGS